MREEVTRVGVQIAWPVVVTILLLLWRALYWLAKPSLQITDRHREKDSSPVPLRRGGREARLLRTCGLAVIRLVL
jgi:hypothetical protein